MRQEGYAGKYLYKDRIVSSLRSMIQPAAIEQQVIIPDVSFYQGDIDWPYMASKVPGVIIRAGQNTWIDSKFVTNYSQAKASGMPRGVYWFYDSRIDPLTQADILISLIGNDLPEMPIFCDWEYDYGGNYFDLSYAVKFMQRVEAVLPVKIGMYTGYYFFRDHSSPTTHFAEYDYLREKPLWIAWYTSNPAYVQIPAPWVSPKFWQYTSSGSI